MFVVAISHDPSSNRAWVSNSKVEYVVKAPRNPTPSARRIASELWRHLLRDERAERAEQERAGHVDDEGPERKRRVDQLTDPA